MRTYGYIYMYCNTTTAREAVNKLLCSGNEDPGAIIERIYQRGVRYIMSTHKRELNELEKASLYNAAKESYRQYIEKPQVKPLRHLAEITKSTFSIENVSETAKRISDAYVDIPVCSVAGFDESALQICIFEKGNAVTVHQIGDELWQMGMDVMKGDVHAISSFFRVPEDSVPQFLQTEDVMDAEEYLFEKIICR